MAKRVFVVDDEEDIRDTVKTLLEKNGFEVETAVSGDDCLKKIFKLKTKPDLILLDIMMPGTPTRDVVKQLKNYKVAFVSVVRVTEAEKEDLVKKGNIVDFIQKPFEINYLLERVKLLTK
jgi:DNA-binding response OmpR family regulator